MAKIERTAATSWIGDLVAGSGMVEFESGALANTPVTWASRTEAPQGKTSPEELIAAAHSSCFAMAFSHSLTESGHKPTSLFVSATVGLSPKPGGGFQVSSSTLNVRGKVPGLDQSAFQKAADIAEMGCPVSNALRGNVRILVRATLES